METPQGRSGGRKEALLLKNEYSFVHTSMTKYKYFL